MNDDRGRPDDDAREASDAAPGGGDAAEPHDAAELPAAGGPDHDVGTGAPDADSHDAAPEPPTGDDPEPDDRPAARPAVPTIVIDTSPRADGRAHTETGSPADGTDPDLDLEALDDLEWPDVASLPGVRTRLPYFERARQPHDWRWVVGGIGRTLITLGLLLFGLVAYQLWGTGIGTAKAQAELEIELEEILAGVTTTSTTSTTTTVPTSVDSTVPTDTTEPDIPQLPPAPLAPNVPSGTALGKIIIPSIDVDWVFVQGVKYADLKLGPGHFRETVLPGQLGNAAIAGHRTTYGHPFYDLDQLDEGDEIITVTALGRHVWEVTRSFVVPPSDYNSVVPTKDFDKATLTLVTCTPKGTSSARLVVRAELLSDESDQVYAAPDVLPSPEVFQSDGDISEVVVAPTTSVAAGSPTPADPTPVTTPVSPQRSDAFSAGWFDDTAAIPHTIGWGLATLAVAVAAWLFGRRMRRLWVVFLTGAAPVVLGLYFFYENVNRLLPPGL